MKIAIIGAGFAGLGLAWYLAKKNTEITLFDKRGLEGGASRTAAGLVHPYSGKNAKWAPFGLEAYQETLTLFNEVGLFQEEGVILHQGMVRLALNQEQEAAFKKAADANPRLQWFEADEAKKYHKDLAPYPGLFVEEALTIEPTLYLNAIMRNLKNTQLIKKDIASIDELNDFDAVVIASGYETLGFKEVGELSFRYLKGQGLEFLLPQDMEPLKYAVNGDIYVVMMGDGKHFFAGATFERGISDPTADRVSAEERILPRLTKLFPKLEGIQAVNVRSNVRLTTNNHFPIVKEMEEKVWVFSGLGSKGLLYHAYLGKKLAGEILKE